MENWGRTRKRERGVGVDVERNINSNSLLRFFCYHVFQSGMRRLQRERSCVENAPRTDSATATLHVLRPTRGQSRERLLVWQKRKLINKSHDVAVALGPKARCTLPITSTI